MTRLFWSIHASCCPGYVTFSFVQNERKKDRYSALVDHVKNSLPIQQAVDYRLFITSSGCFLSFILLIYCWNERKKKKKNDILWCNATCVSSPACLVELPCRCSYIKKACSYKKKVLCIEACYIVWKTMGFLKSNTWSG